MKEKTKYNPEANYIIDVDLLINHYNKENPKLLPLSRTLLAELLGVNTQLFSDWKAGRTPKWVYHLFKMMDIGKCNFDKFIVENKTNK